MSDYFTKNNTVEVGPGPEKDIEWLVIEERNDVNQVTPCIVVMARNGYQALNRAEQVSPGLEKNKCKVVPNPRLMIACNREHYE